MRVFILLPDITLKGGLERFVVNLSELLSGYGCDITILSFFKSNSSVMYKLPDRVTVKYLTNFSFNFRTYKFLILLGFFRLFRARKDFCKELIWISTSPIIGIFFSIFFNKYNKKLIASEHSTYSSHGPIVRFLRSWRYKKIKCVVTQTKDGVESFRKVGVSATKIPNSVTIFEDPQQWINHLGVVEDKFLCLSVARFEEVKQLDHLVEIAKIVCSKQPAVKFLLVGGGQCETYITELISRYDLCSSFSIIQPTNNVSEYYKQASLYLVTSKSEAFPMTVLEALSYGVPVVSYGDLVGPREIITDQKNGWLTPQNEPEEMARAIIDAFSNRVLLSKLSDSAIITARAYHPAEIGALWMDLLK